MIFLALRDETFFIIPIEGGSGRGYIVSVLLLPRFLRQEHALETTGNHASAEGAVRVPHSRCGRGQGLAGYRFLAGVVITGVSGTLVSCTPIGAWLYDDPTFVLSEMTVRGAGNPSDTLEMVLTACNRNDYPIQATGIEVSLEMEGTSLGSVQSSQPYTLQTRDSTKLTVPLAMLEESTDPGTSISYVMTGHTTLQTPIGERRVELFQQGAVALKPRDEVAHIRAAGRPCRPGKSTLPSYMPIPIQIEPPPQPPMPSQMPQ